MGTEDTRSVTGWMGGQVVSIIDAITADELKQLAQELLVGERLRLAVVGLVTEEESLEELLKL